MLSRQRDKKNNRKIFSGGGPQNIYLQLKETKNNDFSDNSMMSCLRLNRDELKKKMIEMAENLYIVAYMICYTTDLSVFCALLKYLQNFSDCVMEATRDIFKVAYDNLKEMKQNNTMKLEIMDPDKFKEKIDYFKSIIVSEKNSVKRNKTF